MKILSSEIMMKKNQESKIKVFLVFLHFEHHTGDLALFWSKENVLEVFSERNATFATLPSDKTVKIGICSFKPK